MLSIEPTGAILGATIRGVDLARALSDPDFGRILLALGQHGVLRFPDQQLDIGDVKRFSELFGEIQGNPIRAVDGAQMYPEVGILSNVKENGVYIGSPDAGQDWHTDMSYNELIGFSNVLYGLRIPHRNGQALGNTVFANMHAAYDELPEALKTRLDGMTASHDFNKFWEEMRRRPGSTRPALTPEQRAKRPAATHPVFMTHPITGRKVLYCNPGYVTRINELDEAESDRVRAASPGHTRGEFQREEVALTAYAGGRVRLSVPHPPWRDEELGRLHSSLRRCS